MELEHLKTLSQISRSLWASEQDAQNATLEALTASTLLNLSEEQTLDRTLLALLRQATRAGVRANSAGLNAPFYRLSEKERLLVSALHFGSYSYLKLSQILRITPEEIAKQIWKARFYLAASAGLTIPVPEPASTRACPDYQADHPWTQYFMDEELNAQQQIFFRNHLMICDSCRATLTRFRKFYYAVESLIPHYESQDQLKDVAKNLKRSWSQSMNVIQSALRPNFLGSLRLSLKSFFSRIDVQIICIAILVYILFV